MNAEQARQLQSTAEQVLAENGVGDITLPTEKSGLYPAQFLWDCAFVSIGQRHLNPDRAAREITSLFRGQWENGMLPHIQYLPGTEYNNMAERWDSQNVPGSSKTVQTSGMTQPPMVAEAAVRVGEHLPEAGRLALYREIYPGLVKHHEWLYRERDPENSGLITLIHSWESGLDDTPPWRELMWPAAPDRVKQLRARGLEHLLDAERPDLKHAPEAERPSSGDYYTIYDLFDKTREAGYDLKRILKVGSIPVAQDVVFNAVLIRANEYLRAIADELKEELPAGLQEAMARTPEVFEELYEDGQYWTRDYRTGRLVKAKSVGGFMALYAGSIPQSHADELVEQATSPAYWPKYGVASTPTTSPHFEARRFWRGPIWENVNWCLIDGMDRYGHGETADQLSLGTLEMVAKSGNMPENFSPVDGRPGGASRFSWTAGLTLDLMARMHLLNK